MYDIGNSFHNQRGTFRCDPIMAQGRNDVVCEKRFEQRFSLDLALYKNLLLLFFEDMAKTTSLA
jgi:hypothetical protein